MNTMRWSEPGASHDDTGPPTIKNHSVTHFQGNLYCFGGYDGRRNHMTLLLYSIQDQLWIPTRQTTPSSSSSMDSDMDPAPLPPHHLHHHHHHHRHHHHHHHRHLGSAAAASLRRASPSAGGHDAAYGLVVSGTPPPGRNGHTATLATDPEDEDHGRIIIIGGWLGSGPLAASDMHVLDVSATLGLRWYQPTVKGTPPGPCNMHTADFFSTQREVYVFRGGNGREYLNDLHALHVDTYTWRRVETNGATPQQRANHSSALLEETGELFIFGGWNGRERLNDVHILDIATSTWTCPSVGGDLPHPRAGMTLTALRGRLFLFGGSGTSSKCFQDLQILDRNEMAWLDVEPQQLQPTSAQLNNGTGGSSSNSHRSIYEDSDVYDSRNLVAVGNRQGDEENEQHRPVHPAYAPWRRQRNHHHHHHHHHRVGAPSSMLHSPNPNDEDTVPTVIVQGKGPGRRAGHTATAVNRRLYVFGGSCGSDYLNDFFVLDTDPPPRAILTEPTSIQLLERRLRHFFNDEDFSDVTFVVEGRRVYGHKMVLSIVSDCFRAMFTTGFRESEAGAEIEIPDCSYDAFTTMMEYIYTGRVPKLEGNQIHRIVDLMELADQFFLDHLKQNCEMLLQIAVNNDTVEFLHQVAQKTNAAQLLAICEHFERNRGLQQQQQQQQLQEQQRQQQQQQQQQQQRQQQQQQQQQPEQQLQPEHQSDNLQQQG